MEKKIVRLKLKLTKKEVRKIGRIKRWEDRSANTNRILGPRKT